MPTYSYKCGDCGHSFDAFKKIADREEPETCPNCHKTDTAKRILTAAKIVSGVVNNINTKVPEAFKDKLREVKKASGKSSTIDV